MGLMAWYPFNGDYKNYGLGDLDLSVATTPAFSTGKTGQGLTTGAFTWNATQSASIFNNNEISICFWLYVNAETGSTTKRAMLFGNDSMGSNNNRKFSLFQYPTCNDFHWYWQNDTTSTTFFTGSTLSGVLPSYTWTHVTITYNNPTGKIYINGVLKHTFTGVSNSSSFAYATQVIHNNAYRTVCDFRVYNNEISAMEVKKISQALILHYPLSGVGGKNLIPNSLCNQTSNVYGFASRNLTLENNTTYTYSARAMVNNDKTVEDNKYIAIYIYLSDWSWAQAFTITNRYPTTKSITFTTPGNIAGKTIAVTAYYYPYQENSGVAPTGTCTLFWYKLEKGEHATPWCPNPSDEIYSQLGFNSEIECDCSGFMHNGTISFTRPEWSSDSMRYSGSYNFGNGSFIATPVLTTSAYQDSWTVAYWGKNSDLTGDMAWGFCNGNRLNLYPADGYFCMNTGDSAQNPFKDASGNGVSFFPYNGSWHHYVITGNGTSNVLYIDGKQVGTSTTYRNITGTQIYISGWDSTTSYKWLGMLSDFRLYATALSASDVADLYNNVGSIDKNGNFYAYEFIEEDTKWN